MKNIKRLLIVALVFSFTASFTTSCVSNKGYKKGKKKKGKRGCNCPSFSADVINWDNAIKLS